MELRNISELKADAAYALRRGREPKQVVLWYAGSVALISAVLTVLNYWLSARIENTGGLSNMGLRSVLSTAQTILPMAQSVLFACLELGYLHAMMRISRRQYADRTDLKVGFQRFFPLFRLVLLQAALYGLLAMLAYQISGVIYMFTPWADALLELLMPMMQSGSTLDVNALMTDAFLTQAAPMMLPMIVIWGILCCVLMIPVSYRLRMANYCLLDAPQAGAMAAMRTSIKITRRNCLKLFKLDLSFWWYYGLLLLMTLFAYLDKLLAMVGIVLPINPTVLGLLICGIYLAALFAVTYFLQNQVQCTYVMAYESICERPKDSGVVLGNIFDMQ